MERIRTNEPRSYSGYDVDFQRRQRAEERSLNPHYRELEPANKLYDKLSIFMSPALGIAAIAGIVWILAAIVKLAIPAKWALVKWIIGALTFLGKWVAVICAVLLITSFLLGLILRLADKIRR